MEAETDHKNVEAIRGRSGLKHVFPVKMLCGFIYWKQTGSQGHYMCPLQGLLTWPWVQACGHLHGAPEPITQEGPPSQGTRASAYLAGRGPHSFFLVPLFCLGVHAGRPWLSRRVLQEENSPGPTRSP